MYSKANSSTLEVEREVSEAYIIEAITGAYNLKLYSVYISKAYPMSQPLKVAIDFFFSVTMMVLFSPTPA